MSIAIIAPSRNTRNWEELFERRFPEEKVWVWPDIPNPSQVEVALVWYHPKGELNRFPNLKLISSMGAGVDHILSDITIPSHIPITRIVDELLANSMDRYVLSCVLHYHRQFFRFDKQKANKNWDMSSPEIPVSVGIFGVGALGISASNKLHQLGFDVCGLATSARLHDGIKVFGLSELDAFVGSINMLVCLLPLTKETEGILNKDLFAKMKRGSALVNAARGKHLVEEDLLWAMDEGIISAAYLDVFQVEPLPREHAFWSRENILITPHIASVTNPEATVPLVMENIYRLRKKEPLLFEISREKGY